MSRLELAFQNEVLLALDSPDRLLFRNAVATAWVGNLLQVTRERKKIMVPSGAVILGPGARRISAGLGEGSSDLIGITKVWIPEPRHVGVFTAIELKTKNAAEQENQEVFIERVRALGGMAGFARTKEEARAIATWR